MALRSSTRPALDLGGAHTAEVTAAVDALVAELQSGWDRHDADTTDASLADDVLWGSPYGATVRGFHVLHDIHRRLKRERRGGARSRFEVVDVAAPAPDVALAQVRRVALDDQGEPIDPAMEDGPFSEMALYVLVRREGRWWLAAGQNTLLRPTPS